MKKQVHNSIDFRINPKCLLKLMIDNCVSKEELAEEVGIGVYQMNCILSGDCLPTMQTLSRLARYFDAQITVELKIGD